MIYDYIFGGMNSIPLERPPPYRFIEDRLLENLSKILNREIANIHVVIWNNSTIWSWILWIHKPSLAVWEFWSWTVMETAPTETVLEMDHHVRLGVGRVRILLVHLRCIICAKLLSGIYIYNLMQYILIL